MTIITVGLGYNPHMTVTRSHDDWISRYINQLMRMSHMRYSVFFWLYSRSQSWLRADSPLLYVLGVAAHRCAWKVFWGSASPRKIG